MDSKTSKVCKRIIAIVFIIISLGLIVSTINDFLLLRSSYHMEDIIFSYAIIIVASLLACLLLCSTIKQNRYKHITKIFTISIIFTYYCFLLIYLLFLSRSYLYISPANDGLFDRLRMNSNLIPFHTINAYVNGAHNKRIVITNLLGNMLAFMPMAFFLPTYFRNLKGLLPFVLKMLWIICIVEIIQAITNVGYFDIDDFILNLMGAIIAFFLCKLKFIRALSDTIQS